MRTVVITDRMNTSLGLPIAFFVLTLMTLSVAPATAQSARQHVEGVKNFGQVTEKFFRGGAVTSAGVDNLASLGVRTFIDLRDKPSPGEPEACKRNFIKYYKFSMDGSVTPDDRAVNEIISIIKNAKQPVYVHCSAGKHRTGMIAAIFRTRVQGWSKEQAWAEQQSYGFGLAEEHKALYTYVYGMNSIMSSPGNASKDAGESKVKSTKSKTKTDDDDGEKDKKSKEDDVDVKDKSSKKSVKSAGSKKQDDDDGGDDKIVVASAKLKNKSDKHKQEEKVRSVSSEESSKVSSAAADRVKVAPASKTRAGSVTRGLSAQANYIAMGEAIKRAKAEGGSGEILKVDLEWDEGRSTVTWDLTFSSGTEYEIDALSGKLLGTKTKAPAKLAMLMPLALSTRRLLTFQKIMRKVELGRGQSVMEMELKHLRGRTETIYELAVSDGTTSYYNAVTGQPVKGI